VTGVTDWSSAGSEGTLPAGFVPWQRGVTCTVRPEWLAPIDPCRTYLPTSPGRESPLDANHSRIIDRCMTVQWRLSAGIKVIEREQKNCDKRGFRHTPGSVSTCRNLRSSRQP
jgi:hypothetical protein